MYLRTNYAIRTSKLEETLGSPQQKIQQHRQQQSDIKDLLIEKVRSDLNIAEKIRIFSVVSKIYIVSTLWNIAEILCSKSQFTYKNTINCSIF